MSKPNAPTPATSLATLARKPQWRDLGPHLWRTVTKSWSGFLLLFWITFPIILGLRILEEFVPLIQIIGGWLEPLMEIVGLPGATGVPWAAAILLQPIPGFALLADNWDTLNLTIAQATIFSVLVLEVHAIFAEMRIAQLLGVRMWLTCVLRFAAAFSLGMLLDWFYRTTNWLQEPATLLFVNETTASNAGSWLSWMIFQGKAWLVFFLLLYFLNLLMDMIRAFHIEKVLIVILSPLMRLMGIHRAAATTAIIGLVLGVSYGAALLLEEKRSGKVPQRDIFLTVVLLSICHSLLDDTLIAVLFGAHISGVFVARFVFAAVVIAVLSRLLDRLPAAGAKRWLMTSH